MQREAWAMERKPSPSPCLQAEAVERHQLQPSLPHPWLPLAISEEELSRRSEGSPSCRVRCDHSQGPGDTGDTQWSPRLPGKAVRPSPRLRGAEELEGTLQK